MNYKKVNAILKARMNGRAWVVPAPEDLANEGFEYCLQLCDDASTDEINLAVEIVNSIEPSEWARDRMTHVEGDPPK